MKIVALAYNYRGYEHPPIVFMKSGQISDGERIIIPPGLTWAEAELAFWINRHGKIGGHGVANDITYEIPGQDCHLAESKCRDTFCPIMWFGSKVEDPNGVSLRTMVNGLLRQEGNTRDRVLDDRAILRHVSQFMTLELGDIVLTGTPPHRGKTQIKDGDIVEVEAVGYGRVANAVRRRDW